MYLSMCLNKLSIFALNEFEDLYNIKQTINNSESTLVDVTGCGIIGHSSPNLGTDYRCKH